MRKLFLSLVIIFFVTQSSFAQWDQISSWFNQAISDVNKASKEVEVSYALVNSQVQASTQQFVNDVEKFANDFTQSMNSIGNDCQSYSGSVYGTVENFVITESQNLGANSNSSPADEICRSCIKAATLRLICRIPETVQGNMAFMDKMNSMMNDPRVRDIAYPAKPVAAVTVATVDDFIDEFTYYFNLLNEFRLNIDYSAINKTEEEVMRMIFSDENCQGLGDQAFDSMLGALKSRAERKRAQKRYAALLKMIKGFENMETVNGWNDQMNQVSSFFPEGKASVGIPAENPLYNLGSAENVFVNATGNGRWVDARNWSKQQIPMPYQVAYIPQGKTVIVDRPITVKDIIDNNNGNGINGSSNVYLTKDTQFYDGHTFTIQAKHSGHSFAVGGDSKEAGGSIIQWNNPGHGSHHFQFIDTGDGDGTYYIQSVWSGLMLDVFGPSYDNGANLGQWTFSGWDNQKFYLDEAGGGYYHIRSKYSGKVLDVSGCSANVGTNTQQWEKVDGAACQMFKLVPATRSGKTFFLETKMEGKRVLDMTQDSYYGPAIHLWDKHNGENQKFLFQLAEVDEEGIEWYYLINRSGNKYIIPAGYGVTNGTRILAGDSNFNDWATMWRLEKYDEEYYYIQHRFGKEVNGTWTGMRYLDLSGCHPERSTVLQLYDKVEGADCQLFKLIETN